MIRQVIWGLLAGTLVVLLLAWTRPSPPPQWLGPEPLVVEDGGTTHGSPLAGLAPAPTTAPVAMAMRLAEVDYRAKPFAQVVEDLRTTTHANIVVNWGQLEAQGIEMSTPVTLRAWNITAREVLTMTLRSAGKPYAELYCRDEGGLVVVTADGPAGESRVYDMRDIVANGIRDRRRFRDAIAATTRPSGESRRLTEPGVGLESQIALDLVMAAAYPGPDRNGTHVTYWAGRLLVTADVDQQEHIQSVLRQLRQTLHR